MSIDERISLLIQTTELAQSNGLFTLDDAVVVKTTIENLNKKINVEASLALLIKVAQLVQKKGLFDLKQAFHIYLAVNNLIEDYKTEKEQEDEIKKGLGTSQNEAEEAEETDDTTAEA